MAGFSLITAPAVVFFLAALVVMLPTPGDAFLRLSDSLVLDAPQGMVMTCPDREVIDKDGKLLPPSPLATSCLRESQQREVWVAGTNADVLFFYKLSVVLGVLIWICQWSGRRVSEKKAGYGKN